MSQVLNAPAGAAADDADAATDGGDLGEFSLSEARRIVGDFFRPNPWIYWTDFLVCWTLGAISFAYVRYPELVTANAAWHWPLSIGLFVASSLLLYMPPIKMGQTTKAEGTKGAVV